MTAKVVMTLPSYDEYIRGVVILRITEMLEDLGNPTLVGRIFPGGWQNEKDPVKLRSLYDLCLRTYHQRKQDSMKKGPFYIFDSASGLYYQFRPNDRNGWYGEFPLARPYVTRKGAEKVIATDNHHVRYPGGRKLEVVSHSDVIMKVAA